MDKTVEEMLAEIRTTEVGEKFYQHMVAQAQAEALKNIEADQKTIAAKKARHIRIGLIILTVLFLWYVFPTPYKYLDVNMKFNGNEFPVRVARLTGEAEWFAPSIGWQKTKN